MTAAQFEVLPELSKTDSGSVELYMNQPNPFIEMTLLRFLLPAAAFACIRIFDSAGAEVVAKQGNFNSGENHVVLHRADLKDSGLYTCRLETPYGTANRIIMMY
jgi:hypothetical protein